MMTEEEFADALEEYFRSMSMRTEAEDSAIVAGWEEQFPNAGTSNLVFWSFREMSYREIAEEVFLRESLYKEGGTQAVRGRMREQAEAALADENTPVYGRNSAEAFLRGTSEN